MKKFKRRMKMADDEREKNTRKGGWGYATYNVDDFENNDYTGYTRFEDNGKVNHYEKNDDDGHGHDYWSSKEEYMSENEAEYSRRESNGRRNVDEDDVEERSGCYLTTACMQNQAENFDDKCYQLEMLRWFRDKYVSKEDKAHYYKVAPTIVAEVDKHPMKNVFYSYIYTHLVDRCVHLIENKEYNLVYDVYKSSVQNFEKRFILNENKNELEK